MSTGTSTFVIRWVNFLTMLVAAAVIGYGVWMSSHHDGCRKSLTLPVMGLGSVIFLISVIGFLGALKNNSILLWMYLIMLCLVLVGILIFTVLVFMVTNNGSGHTVAGLRYKQYQLQDYGSWFVKKLNNTRNWKHLQSCFLKIEACSSMSKRYKTLKQYKLARLTPIEAGCCRPPSQCGYPPVNASYYDLSFHPGRSRRVHKNRMASGCYLQRDLVCYLVNDLFRGVLCKTKRCQNALEILKDRYNNLLSSKATTPEEIESLDLEEKCKLQLEGPRLIETDERRILTRELETNL